MSDVRTDKEVMEALDDVNTTLDVITAHLGLQGKVQTAIAAKRAKREASRLEIERSVGQLNVDGDGRR